MTGTLYGVGVGPGDPELLTLQAVRILRTADVIALPDSGSEGAAEQIIADYIQDKPILRVAMPMTRDADKLGAAHDASAARICALLDEGKTVAFATLGDPSIYSTYIYVHSRVLARNHKAQLICGVPSFCAVAARLNTSICEAGQALHIIPASYEGAFEELSGNIVYMKTGKSLETVKKRLAGKRAMLVERCTMQGERVYPDLQQAKDTSYFSIILVKEGSSL